jgi:hypothetical protein
VSRSQGTPTILIVENDLGFVWWLGQILTEVGCQAEPALRCGDAALLVEELNLGVDIVIANPGLPGASAMIRALVRSRPSLKVVLLRNPGAEIISGIRADVILERPSGVEALSRSEWRRRLRSVLEQAGVTARPTRPVH